MSDVEANHPSGPKQRQQWTGEDFRKANAAAVELALHALTTDGAHHKQWYLERIVEALGIDLEHYENTTGFRGERGIAP